MSKTTTKLLRIKSVSEKTEIGKSTIWLWVSQGKFPKPKKLSPRITVWEESKVEAWIKRRVK
jgi:prophage regulatory protein